LACFSRLFRRQVEREVVEAQAAYESLVRSTDLLAEEEMVAAAQDELDLISQHVTHLSDAADAVQQLLTQLTNLERDREAQIERRYQASDRRLLAEGERLRFEIGQAEARRTQVLAAAGPTARQMEAARSLEEEVRQLDATLPGLESQRDEASRQLREAVARRDEAQSRERELEVKYGDVAAASHAAKAAQARAMADMALVDRAPKGMKPEDHARLQMLRAKHGVHVAANLARGHKAGRPAASRPVAPPA
jgi:chromosome segregation ATPase